ncbi:MAG: TPM domain-containing protein [Candidatus Omnitrophota bacterium]
MSKFYFTIHDLETIKEAVKEAESKTSGEIAVAFIKESDDYARYELIFAIFAGFFYFLGLMFFSQRIEHLMQDMFWGYSSSYLLMLYGFTTFIIMGVAYALSNLQFIDRIIIPKSAMKRKVQQRAVRHFMESGVYNTQNRNGVLIFISDLERRVELLADRAINEKIPKDQWENIVSHVIDGVHTNQTVRHLAEAIKECGNLLARHFPIQPDNTNELSDDVHVLEN